MADNKAIVCLNYAFRIQDNPLLIYCAKNKLDIIPVVLFDESLLQKLGAAEKLWLDKALEDFNQQLGQKLLFLQSKQELKELLKKEKISHLLYASHFDSRINIDLKDLTKGLEKLDLVSLPVNYIFDPKEIRNKSGGIFKVFTPFYKHCISQKQTYIEDQIKNHLSNNIQKHIEILKLKSPNSLQSYCLKAKEKKDIAWQNKMLKHWDISEKSACLKLDNFIENQAQDYLQSRDIPGNEDGTSKLSPYLHFGMISPFRIWFELEQAKANIHHEACDGFLRQLCWREFAAYILYHFPSSKNKNLNPKFDKFPWKKNKALLRAWQQGKTGYPIVDAGMRELWETGWMHNRVRMIVGSFLIKDLGIHWLEGLNWFEDTLFDADLPNNVMGWQWVAGSGVDASPYFRIFNPMTQSEKFDKEGKYIRKWVPELAKLDNKWIHKPFEAPELILEAAEVKLGDNYPKPLVDHKQAREEALATYQSIK